MLPNWYIHPSVRMKWSILLDVRRAEVFIWMLVGWWVVWSSERQDGTDENYTSGKLVLFIYLMEKSDRCWIACWRWIASFRRHFLHSRSVYGRMGDGNWMRRRNEGGEASVRAFSACGKGSIGETLRQSITPFRPLFFFYRRTKIFDGINSPAPGGSAKRHGILVVDEQQCRGYFLRCDCAFFKYWQDIIKVGEDDSGKSAHFELLVGCGNLF